MKSSRMVKALSFIFFLLFINSCATDKTLVKTPPPETPALQAKGSIIQKISFIEEENDIRILIEGSDNIAPPFYKLLSDPLRLAVDIPNVDLTQIKAPLKIDNGTVGEVSATQYDDKGRIEIGLVQMADYNISEEGKNLIIDIEKVKTSAQVKEAKEEEDPVKEKEPEKPSAESGQEEIPSPQAAATVPASVPEPMNKAKEILRILPEEKKDFVSFKIVADGKIENYNSFRLDSPPRLVLDILEVGSRYPKKSVKIKNSFIKKVRIGRHPDKLRLVFDSLKPHLPLYQINRIDDKLIVSFGNVPQPSGPQILLEEKTVEESSAPKMQKVSAVPPTVQGMPVPVSGGLAKTAKASTLTTIDFKQMDDKSRIVVRLTEEPKFETHTISKKMIAIDIQNAFVPKHLQKGLDTSEFESAVSYIDLQNIKAGDTNDVRISIKLREEVPFEASLEGKTLFIDFEKPKKIVTEVKPLPPPEKKEMIVETQKEELKPEEEKPILEAKKPETVLPETEEKPMTPQPEVSKKVEGEKKAERGAEEPSQEKVYTGRKLSLDFKDAEIKNILRLIAEVSNLNIIAGDDVTGKITMRLVDVPWDQALDVILQARSLGKSQVGNVVRVAPLETLKKETQSELEAKRVKERLEDLVTELIPVNYASAKEVMPQVKSILSERGDVRVDERTNILIVKDIEKNIPKAKELVKSLDTKTPQVLIEARIVEANLTFQRELGVQWGFLASTGTDKKKTGTVGGGMLGTSSLGGTSTITNNVVSLPALAQGGVSGVGTASVLEFLFSSAYGLKQLDVAISAHENKGDVKIISSPKIATLDNKEASIEQGLRIPYRKLTTEGTITTDFIDANLKLTVKPHVTNDGHIKMEIKAKKDAPDTSITVDGVPSIDKKEAITEVLIKDNGVIVIAGVYSIEKDEGAEGVPLFNKIPLLGWLFKRESKQDKRKDLLIFISPKIIRDQV
jgi:type IV pilus assembly protein PilQ